MSNSSLEIPTNVSKPRCSVLEPITNESQAHNQAGEHRGKVFGLDLKRLLSGRREVTVETELVERRMVAFWHVRCRSHFDYTRMKEYEIAAQDPDAVSITLRGNDAQGSRLELLYRVDATGRSKGQVKLSGIERCVTDRTVEEYIDSYTKADNLPARELESRRKALSESAKQRLRPVEDIEAFGNHGLVDGVPLFNDNIRTIVVPPLETADAVVLQTLRKAMVPIEAATIYEWFLEVTNVDLYFRPLYVFEFKQLDRNGNPIGRKREELDALNRDRWVNLETTEYQMPTVPWVKILKLSADVGAIMLRDVPILGTGMRIAGTIADQAPDIIDDLK